MFLRTNTPFLFETMKNKRVRKDLSTREKFSLTPLAIPMLAGPGSISLLITFSQEYLITQDILILNAAIIFVGILTYFILRSSFLITKFLGASGINAISRIVGFIVIAIGVEYIIVAVLNILKTISI